MKCLTAGCNHRTRYGVNLPRHGSPFGGEIVHSCGYAGCFLRLAVLCAGQHQHYRLRAWRVFCSTASDGRIVAAYAALPVETVMHLYRLFGEAMFTNIGEIVLEREELRRAA